MSADKELYDIIADEMSTKTVAPALWTQALASAAGNPYKAQACVYQAQQALARTAGKAVLGLRQLANQRVPAIRQFGDGKVRLAAAGARGVG
jgi:uncharacterized membrane protein YqiK